MTDLVFSTTLSGHSRSELEGVIGHVAGVGAFYEHATTDRLARGLRRILQAVARDPSLRSSELSVAPPHRPPQAALTPHRRPR